MFARIRNSLIFRLEQLMMRGAVARFGVLLLLVVLVSLVAGAVVRQIAPGFDSTADAIWWAFLRLTDPGYLGDDEGVAKATVSTAITVLGYILFMGALIAILVHWLSETMDRLELGLTPVALDAHFVLVGWTSRTPTILEEILVSQGRVERFLRRRGARRLHVAVLAERADATLRQEVKVQLGEHWNARQIILRSGSPLRLEDLERVDFAHAGAILIPAADTAAGRPVVADTRTILGYLLLRELLEANAEAPPVLVELTDPDNITLFDNRRGEVIVSPVIVSHMMARVALRRELRAVYEELFSSGGCEIFFRRVADFGLADLVAERLEHDLTVGEYTFADLQRAADARGEIAIGIRRGGQEGTPHGGVALNPGRDEHLKLDENDELIVLTTYDRAREA